MTLRPQGLSKKKKEWWAPSFSPSDVSSVLVWLDDPALPGNVIEAAFTVSEWTGEVGGIDADQATVEDQGLRTNSEIVFDGASENMDLESSIASFNQSSGEFFIVGNDLEGVGAGFGFLNFGDKSGTSNHVQFGMIGGDTTYAIV